MKTSLVHSKELDGMRGCACIMVYIFHLFTTIPGYDNNPGMSPYKNYFVNLVGLGSFGVDIFFVLSGFLITSLLLIDRKNPHYFNNFYWKRILRIQPVYLLHLVAAWLLIPNSKGYIIAALLFVVNFAPYLHVTAVGPAWTLAIEEQFYLIWPQFVRRLSMHNLYRVCIALVVGSASLRIGMDLIMRHWVLLNTWYRFDGLALGALAACQWIGEEEGLTPALRSVLAICNGRLMLVLTAVYQLAYICNAAKSRSIALLTVNFLVYRAIRYIMHQPRSKLLGWLATPALVFCGSISYCFYMFHAFFVFLYDSRIAQSLDPGKFALRGLVVAVVSVLFCVLIRYTVELPAQKLRRYVLR